MNDTYPCPPRLLPLAECMHTNHLFWETGLHIIQDFAVLMKFSMLLFADKQAGGDVSSDTFISALRRTDRTCGILCRDCRRDFT